MNRGFVFDIQRFSVHDGPGIRTTIFLGGCPLRCRWCHNPEGLTGMPKLRFDKSHCISCGICADNCSCHFIDRGDHNINRASCTRCGKCADVCPSDALSIIGHYMTSSDITDAAIRDFPFYGEDGGVTFSGGEPLLQPKFVAECAKKCHEQGISTAIDTCGYVPRENIDSVIPYTDHFLYDIKAVTEEIHILGTGKPNACILDGCRYLSYLGKSIHVRIPVIGTVNDNDSEIKRIAEFLSELPKLPASVTLIPYHSLGREKYKLFGIEAPNNNNFDVSTTKMKRFRKIMAEYGLPITDNKN